MVDAQGCLYFGQNTSWAVPKGIPGAHIARKRGRSMMGAFESGSRISDSAFSLVQHQPQRTLLVKPRHVPFMREQIRPPVDASGSSNRIHELV
jgi:hypothetical protein